MRNRQRKSIRLKGYDYSQRGAYFITICTQNREYRFGEIIDGEIMLNDAGRMIEKWYFELENKFNNIRCDTYVIMPNHIHFILINTAVVGAKDAKCVAGGHIAHGFTAGGHITDGFIAGGHVGPPLPDLNVPSGLGDGKIEHDGSSLFRLVQWFKTMTTNEYIIGVKNKGWLSFDKKLWQRNYFEHVIRNEKSLHNIREYIVNNRVNWQYDDMNNDAGTPMGEHTGSPLRVRRDL